jgi:hypothetical protein
METSVGRVLSVNVGTVREFEFNGRPAKSAVWKSPVAGQVVARGVNLDGDDQADRKAHGGPDKAVYAYAVGTRSAPPSVGTDNGFPGGPVPRILEHGIRRHVCSRQDRAVEWLLNAYYDDTSTARRQGSDHCVSEKGATSARHDDG